MSLLVSLYLMTAAPAQAQIVRVNQGWSPEVRERVYQEYEGSQLMPLNWFLALEAPNSQKSFISSLSTYGFLDGGEKSNNRALNPARLPIGMTTFSDPQTAPLYGEKTWVGLNCAACHTSVMEVRGRKLVVEGGANMLDFDRFQTDLLSTVETTLANPQKFNRFRSRLSANDEASLKNSLSKFRADFREHVDRNKYVVNVGGKNLRHRLGPERMDGLALPNNEILCALAPLGDLALRSEIALSANCRNHTAPSGIPQIWGTYHDEYTHYQASIHSSIGRNFGQAAGVFAKNWVERNAQGEPVFHSTANLDGLTRLENWYKALRAPEWNDLVSAGVVARLNPALVEKGRALYQEKKCQTCHAIQPELSPRNLPGVGREFWRVNVSTIQEVQTDPARLQADLFTTVKLPKMLEKRFVDQMGADKLGPNGQVSASLYRAVILRELIFGEFAQRGFSKIDMLKASSCRVADRVQPKSGYKSRSLEGIAFSAPFLHNSSVPTLDDLFKPARLRPKAFYVGCRNYDMARVGYNCRADSENAFLVNTALPGHSNHGHEFGTDMNQGERIAMIEFLKSLQNPKRPALGACE